MSLQSISKALFAHEEVSDELWSMAYALLFGGLTLLVGGFACLVYSALYSEDWVTYVSLIPIIFGAPLAAGG